jgi:hypothetical protein
MIIPRSPSPVPLLERNVDTLSLEETRELLRKRVSQGQMKEHDCLLTLSQQREDAAAFPVKKEPKIKQEREPEHRATTSGEDDEICFVSSKRRKLPSSTINEDGIETFDLT